MCKHQNSVTKNEGREREVYITTHYVCVCVCTLYLFTIIKREIVSKWNYSISVVCMLIKSITSLGQKAVLVHSTCAITH